MVNAELRCGDQSAAWAHGKERALSVHAQHGAWARQTGHSGAVNMLRCVNQDVLVGMLRCVNWDVLAQSGI